MDAGNTEHEDRVEQNSVVVNRKYREIDVNRLIPHLLIGVEDEKSDGISHNPQHTDRRQEDSCHNMFNHCVPQVSRKKSHLPCPFYKDWCLSRISLIE